MKENWKDIDELKGYYQISNLGTVKSLKRYVNHAQYGKYPVEEKILKLGRDTGGYHISRLRKDNHIKTYRIHRLVASVFIPNLNNLPQVNHKDGNRVNNCVDNLEWCDASHNQKHAYAIGLHLPKPGEDNVNNKLTELQARIAIRCYQIGTKSLLDFLAGMLNVSYHTVWAAGVGRNWKYLHKQDRYKINLFGERKHYCNKLHSWQIRVAIRCYQMDQCRQGVISFLSDIWKVHYSTLRRASRGVTWKHIYTQEKYRINPFSNQKS